jgi:hypothetical protein
VDYTYTTINVNWLAAGVLLISSGVGLLNDQIQYTYAGIECVSASASGFQGPAAMTNKKQAILKMHIENRIKRSGIRINCNKNNTLL